MRKLIFFVDDEKSILNLLEYTMKIQDDYEIKTFSSGEDCIENLELNPDLIVLDHKFKSGGTSGLETLKKIRKTNNTIPVIILSAWDQQKICEDYYNAGATKYLTKDNYFIDSIMDTINQYL